MSPKLLLAAIGALAPLPAGLAADQLNVEPGLWEIASTTEFSGQPPVPEAMLEKLTPQQRAEMDAAFRAEAAKGPQSDIDRECITAEDLERPFAAADAEECTQTIAATTRTTQEVRLACTGEHKGSGVLRVTAPTPRTMSGTLQMTLGEGQQAMTIKSQLKGRWLGPDCGDEDDRDDAALIEEDER